MKELPKYLKVGTCVKIKHLLGWYKIEALHHDLGKIEINDGDGMMFKPEEIEMLSNAPELSIYEVYESVTGVQKDKHFIAVDLKSLEPALKKYEIEDFKKIEKYEAYYSYEHLIATLMPQVINEHGDLESAYPKKCKCSKRPEMQPLETIPEKENVLIFTSEPWGLKTRYGFMEKGNSNNFYYEMDNNKMVAEIKNPVGWIELPHYEEKNVIAL